MKNVTKTVNINAYLSEHFCFIMKRKNFIGRTVAVCAAFLPVTRILAKSFHYANKFFITSGPERPITIYNN
jgi:hypothetical protein